MSRSSLVGRLMSAPGRPSPPRSRFFSGNKRDAEWKRKEDAGSADDRASQGALVRTSLARQARIRRSGGRTRRAERVCATASTFEKRRLAHRQRRMTGRVPCRQHRVNKLREEVTPPGYFDVARRRPSPTKRAPVARRIVTAANGLSRSRRLIAAAAHARNTLQIVPLKMNTVPRK